MILIGSLAHGFASDSSDVDVAIVVYEQEYEERKRRSGQAFYDEVLYNYPGGYVDGKYISLKFIEEVASRGSEPARFAFKDAIILFSRTSDHEAKIEASSRFPS